MVNSIYVWLCCCLFCSLQSMNDGKIVFCDFEKDKDAECLEKIFESDYKNLVRGAQEYQKKMGTNAFTTWANDAEINVRKIMRFNELSIGYIIYFVLYKNTRYKGFQDGDVLLVSMGVDPDKRGRGHGREIMHYLKKSAYNLDADMMWLSVNSQNEKAQRLYKNSGFKNTGDISSHTSYWWYAYIFNNAINKRALYDRLIEQKNCDLNINFL